MLSQLPPQVPLRPGEFSKVSHTVGDFSDQSLLESSSSIVVHGVDSLGHFQASKSGHLDGVGAFITVKIVSSLIGFLVFLHMVGQEDVPGIDASSLESSLDSPDLHHIIRKLKRPHRHIQMMQFH